MIIFFKIIYRVKSFLFIFFLKIKYGRKIKIGKKVVFRKKVNILIEKDGELIIGNNNFFNNSCSINCMNKIIIGDNNLFGESVKLYDHDHKINIKNRTRSFNYGVISIGNNNWIGSDCIILRKAKIGNNNVISCKNIINSEIESNTLIKLETIIKLEEIKYKEE